MITHGMDEDRPNPARVYDYLLGGGHNFEADRIFADRLVAHQPDTRRICLENRAFLTRAVRWCLEQGIEQFLDLGSGVPTGGNVHEIAHRVDPAARVAYVDADPVAVAHTAALTAGLDTVTATQADLRDPADVLGAPTVTGLIDFDRPCAVLAVAVLHHLPDDLRPAFARYREVLAPGGVMVLGHGSDDWDDPVTAERTRAVVFGHVGGPSPVTLRSRSELLDLVDGLDVVPPGPVDITAWPAARAGVEPAGAYALVALSSRYLAR